MLVEGHGVCWRRGRAAGLNFAGPAFVNVGQEDCMSTQTWWETVGGTGGAVLDQLKKLLAAGNVRRVRVRQKGEIIAEFPLTVGLVGAVFAPLLAAIGAMTALVTGCTIEVERQRTPDAEEPPPPPDSL